MAHINAVEARDSKRTSKLIMRSEATAVLGRISDLSVRFAYRSEHNPTLSVYEKELMDRPKEPQWNTGKADPIGDVKRAMIIMGKTGITL